MAAGVGAAVAATGGMEASPEPVLELLSFSLSPQAARPPTSRQPASRAASPRFAAFLLILISNLRFLLTFFIICPFPVLPFQFDPAKRRPVLFHIL